LTACKGNAPAEGEADSDSEASAETAEATPEKTVVKPPPKPASIPAPPDVAAAPENAESSESGLAWTVLQEGTGDKHPAEVDIVTVNYTGWTTEGRMFDSSTKRGKPAEFPLNRVIKGWTEGLQLMVSGEKRRFWIPGNLAYGEAKPSDPHAAMGPPRGTLVFDVELVSFTEAPKPPDTPKDLAKIPKSAKKTKSGLASRVLTKGTGTDNPIATSVVTVHYSGWTTDGKMFDSSVVRGKPATFGLNQVIPGWTEGLQLMVVGETRRLWIPEDLAYKGRAGRPAGMLVFDVELIGIK
jgi:peptidylprolyl isomerase